MIRESTIMMTPLLMLLCLSLAATHFYRAYADSFKRRQRCIKGINYILIFVAIIIAHTIAKSQEMLFYEIIIFIIFVGELAYYIDQPMTFFRLIKDRRTYHRRQS